MKGRHVPPLPAEETVIAVTHGRNSHVRAECFVKFDVWSVSGNEHGRKGWRLRSRWAGVRHTKVETRRCAARGCKPVIFEHVIAPDNALPGERLPTATAASVCRPQLTLARVRREERPCTRARTVKSQTYRLIFGSVFELTRGVRPPFFYFMTRKLIKELHLGARGY